MEGFGYETELEEHRKHGLVSGKLSNGAVLFQSVSLVAPAGGIATVAILGANFAGGALPLATIFAVVGCLFVALSMSQLAKHLPSAGSVGTYVVHGLGGGVGFVTAWMYTIAEVLVVSFASLLVGALVAGTGNSEFGWPFTATWVITVVVIFVLISVVHELGVGVSTKVQQVISTFEILLFLALAVTLIVKAGNHNTLAVFTTKFANVPGYSGLGGLFPAAVFIVTAFAGFESAASLAEEAREPRKAVRTAVVGAVLAVGLLYVLTSYAATVFFGPSKMAGFAATNSGDPWTFMARHVWGVGWVALFLVVANSLYGACTAGTNVSTRMLYSLGRARLVPSVFGRVSRRRTPFSALVIEMVIALGLALWLGLQYGPITGLSIEVVTSTSFIVVMYILVDLACMMYFWRHRRAEHNWLLHFILPLLGILVFLPVLFAELGIRVFSFISKLSAPLTYGAYAAVGLVVIAIVIAVSFAVRHPERLKELGRVFDPENETRSTGVVVEPDFG